MLPDPFITVSDSNSTLTAHRFTFFGEDHIILTTRDDEGRDHNSEGIVLTVEQALALAAALKVSALREGE